MTEHTQSFPNQISYKTLTIATLIVVVALIIRLFVLVERGYGDIQFMPEAGTDPLTYLNNARGILDGTFPSSPHWYHPGPSYVYALEMMLFGDNVVAILIMQTVFDALSVGFLIGTGWLLTKRAWGGYAAGLMYALYPIAIFYSTTGLIVPQSNLLLILILFFTIWQREKMVWWRTILLGLCAGYLALERYNLFPVAGLTGLWILSQLSVPVVRRFAHAAVFSVIAFAVIAPITWTNYQLSNDFILVKTVGAEVYRANSRESGARDTATLAMQNLDVHFQEALRRDIQLAPMRFVGLMGYKVALFWSHFETPNNVSYYRAEDASWLLRLLPINFWWLASSGLLGLALLWRQDKPATLLLGTLILWVCISYLIVFAYGRLRHPVSIPLALLFGVTVVNIIDDWRHRHNWQKLLRRYGIPMVLTVGLLGFSQWVLYPEPKLPQDRWYRELPTEAVRVDASFGDVTLVGWRPIPIWESSQNGWVGLYNAYTVELFWHVNQPTDIQYNFFLAYVDEGIRYEAADQPIGMVAFPYQTTDEWRDERILGEIIQLRFDDGIPLGRSGQIRAGVWYWDDAGQIVNVPTTDNQANVPIQSLAVFQPLIPLDIPTLPESNIIFGDSIVLEGYQLPETANPEETITVALRWQALQNITEDYRLFLHVVDENGELVTQGDNLPIPELLTSNWLTEYSLHSELPLVMPIEADTYEIYIGLYNTIGRLSVDAPNNSVLLGTITVE